MMLNNTLIFGLFTGIVLIISFILDINKTFLGLKKG